MIERLLETIASRHFLVNNLFQRSDGTWQCNLRNASHAAAWGFGPTCADALAEAIFQMNDLVPLAEHAIAHSVEPAFNLRSLIKPRADLVDFKRRI